MCNRLCKARNRKAPTDVGASVIVATDLVFFINWNFFATIGMSNKRKDVAADQYALKHMNRRSKPSIV